jgi:hypothetical protein
MNECAVPSQDPAMHRPKITIAGRPFHLPASRIGRMALGGVFIAGGLVGFLPVVGFWMVPVGLLILSIDVPAVRRRRRRIALWWGRRRERKAMRA